MKEEGTSGYQLVTHHHTEAQPCFSLYPQLTPLSDALCSQTHRTLGKIENKVGLRERAARQAGDLRGSVSADRHACQSALWIRRPSGVRPSIPTRGSPVPSARVSQSTAPPRLAAVCPCTGPPDTSHSPGERKPLLGSHSPIMSEQ